MITRQEVDGQNRAAVFSALRSFDHTVVVSEEDRSERTFGLLDLPESVKKAVDQERWVEAQDRLAEHYFTREQPACKLKSERPNSAGVDEILKNVFTFYEETHDLGDDINWEHNPGTAHWGHDLNRFNYMGPLMGAFLETEDRIYAEKAVGLIMDWIAKTDVCDAFIPGKSPYVWRSYLNIHIHLSAWAEALEILLPERAVSPADLMRILKSVHDQLAYLEIVIPEQSNNWVVFGAAGMLKTALFFHKLRDSERWVRYAWDRLEEQADHQILPDGVQFEGTPHYHYGVARSYVTSICLTERSGRPVPGKAREAVRKMVHYLHQTVTPDRKQVSFNDSDPNCGPGVAAFVRDRATLEACGHTKSRVTDGKTFEDLPSEAFPYGGVYILRDRDLYMAFDGGPFGAAHQHEDKLSFWLAAYGRSLVVDPGRYLYDPSTPFRAYLMSTRAHSTILVDGQGQCSRRHPDRWVSQKPLPNVWMVEPGRVRVGASYELGYGEEGQIAVTHRRSILFVPGQYWILFDRLQGTGTHEVESRFQFAPGELRIEDGAVHTRFEDANLMVRPVSGAGFEVGVEKGQHDPMGGWYSDGYNRIEPAPQAIFRAKVDLPFGVAMLLLPYRGPEPPEVVFERVDVEYTASATAHPVGERGGRGYRVVVDGREMIYTESS